MDFIQKYELKHEHEHERPVVVVHLDPFSEEFASELGTQPTTDKRSLKDRIAEKVKKRFSGLGSAKVVVMVGGLFFFSMNMGSAQAESNTFNMSYLFFGTPETQVQFVDRTEQSVQVVSPSYFDIHEDGSLKLTRQFSEHFISEMDQRDIQITPFLSNHWDRELGRVALENREQLSTQIADVIEEYDLHGVNVDIENVTHDDRDDFTDLVRLLREKIPDDKEVSVAVAANPNGWTQGWHGMYDYEALAEYADYLMLMAYDESYSGGPAGPVASYPWVERSVEQILQSVPSDQVVLGLPFFGRYWVDGQEQGGFGISKAQTEQLVAKYDGEITYHEDLQSPEATFTIEEGDPTSTVSGRTLHPGTYTVWFENEQSLEAKTKLVHQYDLKGTGSWALGQENPAIWGHFSTWLNNVPPSVPVDGEEAGEPVEAGETVDQDAETPVETANEGKRAELTDIQTHWAKEDIQSIRDRGWMRGRTDTTFVPEGTLTRAEAAVTLVNALELEPIQEVESSFQDVRESFWGHNQIEIAKQHGLISGRSEAVFAPNDTITREEMAVILDRVLEREEVSSENQAFRDITPDRWSADAIHHLTDLGIIKGYPDGTFGPNGQLKRAEIAVILTRMMPYIDEILESIQDDEPLVTDEVTIDEPTSNVSEYTVKSGDTLFSIARMFDTTVSDLRDANNLTDDTIRVGQVLTVPGEIEDESPTEGEPSPEPEPPETSPEPDPDEDQVSVATDFIIDATEEDIDLMSRLVHAEARGEPYEGKVAVASVVVNRVLSDEFPNTIEGVIYETHNDGTIYAFEPVQNGQIERSATDEDTEAVIEALKGADSTGGSLFFYNPDTSTSPWVETLTTQATIGNHVFAV